MCDSMHLLLLWESNSDLLVSSQYTKNSTELCLKAECSLLISKLKQVPVYSRSEVSKNKSKNSHIHVEDIHLKSLPSVKFIGKIRN